MHSDHQRNTAKQAAMRQYKRQLTDGVFAAVSYVTWYKDGSARATHRPSGLTVMMEDQGGREDTKVAVLMLLQLKHEEWTAR